MRWLIAVCGVVAVTVVLACCQSRGGIDGGNVPPMHVVGEGALAVGRNRILYQPRDHTDKRNVRQPLLQDGVLLVEDKAALVAVNTEGKTLWRSGHYSGANTIRGVKRRNDDIYVLTGVGQIWHHDAHTGEAALLVSVQRALHKRGMRFLYEGLLKGKYLWWTSDNGILCRIDLSTLIVTAIVPGSTPISHPAIWRDCVVVVAGKSILAFSSRTGDLKFRFGIRIPFETSIIKYLAVEDDLLAVTEEGGIYCVNMNTQKLVSSVQTPIYGSSAPPILRNGVLVTAGGSSPDAKSELIGVDVRTGKVIWRRFRWGQPWVNNISAYGSHIVTVEYGGLLCYGAGDEVFLAIRDLATGELRRKVPLPELIKAKAGVVVCPPILCGSSVFVCSVDGCLVRVD